MSIFPQINFEPTTDNPIKSNDDLKLLKEYAWDFNNNKFIIEDGKFKIVTGKEAAKVWIWKVLHTQRYRYMAYSWDYGNELEELIGKGYSEALISSEAERYLKESILINKYIKSIKNVQASINDSSINISFTADTVYGEVVINVQ